MVEFIASASFGLEGIAARELRGLGLKNVVAFNGGASFSGDYADAARANINLRCADRVRMVVGRFGAHTFDQLFEGTKALPWLALLPKDARIPVSGKCVRAQLMSVSDCQAIVKKAIVDKLRQRAAAVPETGATFPVEISVRGDEATVTLDTTGDALNRRGYRTWNGEAPLRETLAAAIVQLSGWRPGLALHDPMCGTGTIPIEAALIDQRRAPGLARSFVSESWPGWVDAYAQARTEASARFDNRSGDRGDSGRQPSISGGDSDAAALDLARRHARQANMTDYVSFFNRDASGVNMPERYGAFICNPPYGVRLGGEKESEQAIRVLRTLRERHPGWSMTVISAHPGFERVFGARADRKPRVYNGRLECAVYTYLAH
ncbi:MAG: class I SAM-dependent RNA methyltransferase [Oscillospiraceae bacterium]|jgi:putative N6-adenine-specific DNA methylase|nr:class I SAM-dependent RNA methyltransferase [Oscillospiraceae bacterium]